ncbi:hypothetical protein [Paraburkholderia kururiensis]|uniref:hypothetical protein n=1 Tax=Paraburkholderia kururiensis TaxID=984307 RepID=UPI0018F63F6D|nr:hypothetical protein [Paraburkholderia kururiensis]
MQIKIQQTATVPKIFFGLAAFVTLFIVYFCLFNFWERNSDDANSLIAGFEIFRGNPLLRGWRMPTDTFYFTDLVPAAFLTLFLGLSPKILVILPALIWSATVCFFSRFASQLDAENPWAPIWVFACLGLPIVVDTHAMRLIGTAPMHISTVLFGGMVFRFVQLYWADRSNRHLLGAFVVATLGTYSDPFIVFVSLGPAIVVCAWNWLEVRRDRCVSLIGVLALSIVLGRGLAVVVWKMGGVELAAQPIAFAKFEELPNNFALITRSLLMIFGADFTGRAVGVAPGGSVLHYFAGTPITMFVRLIFVVCTVAAAIATLRRHAAALGRDISSDGKSFVMACLATSIVLSCVAAFVSNQMQNLESARYLLPALLYGVVLSAAMFSKMRIGRAFVVVAAILSALAVAGTMSIARTNATYVGKNIDGLGTWLVANDLHEGYGPYWSASAVTMASNGDAKVRAIASDQGGPIHPYLWLADRRWYSKPIGRRFILVDKVNPGNYTTEQVIAQFGKPAEIKQISIYDVLVYDADKSDLSALMVSH